MKKTPIYLYNTLSGKKEEFRPLEEGKVGIYNCGPTVYDTVHIGNLRTFITDDILRRVFEYNNYQVTQVMNITDIDDKTIKKSQEKNISRNELTKYYENTFLSDIHSVNILTPNKLLRATDHIQEMISMIANLINKKIAYQAKDGIYFSINNFKSYGKLSRVDLTKETYERISNDEYDKENPKDFALWKFHTKEDGDNYWEAPFGKGRPGWHIECSAMAMCALGETIDIHTGGVDLIFPHHENEIAQSEASSSKPFAKYWVHGAFMNVNDDKMAKSKGNSFKLADLIGNGISPLAFRYWLLTSHYRSQVNFTIETLKAAQTAYIRLIETFIRYHEEPDHVHPIVNQRNYKNEFLEKINSDLDMPGAIALTWDLIKDHTIEAKEKIALLSEFDKVFGLGLKVVMDMRSEGHQTIPPEISLLAETRLEARTSKEWEKADAIRAEIEERGYEIKDVDDGYKLKKK